LSARERERENTIAGYWRETVQGNWVHEAPMDPLALAFIRTLLLQAETNDAKDSYSPVILESRFRFPLQLEILPDPEMETVNDHVN